MGRIGAWWPNRAQHPFFFYIFIFLFPFSLIFESKFKFQICDELVLKFSEYMIWINHCGINLSIYKFYFFFVLRSIFLSFFPNFRISFRI